MLLPFSMSPRSCGMNGNPFSELFVRWDIFRLYHKNAATAPRINKRSDSKITTMSAVLGAGFIGSSARSQKPLEVVSWLRATLEMSW